MSIASPQTAADQFHYHGLFLVGERGRLREGEQITRPNLRGVISDGGAECFAFLAASVGINGQTTDEIDTGVEQFTACDQGAWFGDLPFSFELRLGDDGSATIEGPMGVRTGYGCVYEGDRLGGSVELERGLNVHLGGTFTLVEEEEPGAECPAVESVYMNLGAERDYGDYIGAARPTVTGLSPGGGPEAGGTSVTITGAGLGEAASQCRSPDIAQPSGRMRPP